MSTKELIIYAMPFLLKGLGTTIAVAICAILLGLVIGILITVIRLVKCKPLEVVASVYVSFVRGTPFLIQIYLIYYGISAISTNISPFITGVLCLGFNTGAFLSEIIRAGVSAIPIGHIEAAKALGMTQFQILYRIVFPQVFNVVKPQLITEFITDIKGTPMLSVVALVELTRAAQRINNRKFQPIPIFITIAIMYFIVNCILEELVKFVDKRSKQRQVSGG